MERNVTLDYFKLLLSFLVITIHVDPLFHPESLGGWLVSNGLARIAVPCFFIINGYYLVRKIDNWKAIKKYLGHLIVVYVVWTLVYLRFYLGSPYMDTELYLEFIFLGYDHLWYVPGLISGVLLLFGAKKLIKNDKALLIIGLVIFIAGYWFEPYRYKTFSFRNGLFLGFPFITMGYYICKYDLEKKINDKFLLAVIVFNIAGLLFDSYIAYLLSIKRDLYLSLPFLCPALLGFIFKHSRHKPVNLYLTYLGSMSSAVYFIHYYMVRISDAFGAGYGFYKLPFIIGTSLAISVIVIFLNKRIKIFL